MTQEIPNSGPTWQLKEIVRQIVLAQGNEFIKDLLRENNIKIGSTKEEFAVNLNSAIDLGKLTQEIVEKWLIETEGWGNQHLYLFAAPRGNTDIVGRIRTSKFGNLLDQSFNYKFPAELELTAIRANEESISFIWQQGKEGWTRTKAKDYQEQVGLDLYRFEAYRQLFDRSSVRFEWRFRDRYCAILIHRNKDIDHQISRATVFEVLKSSGLINDSLASLSLNRKVMRASRSGDVRVHTTRLETSGGFVELGSTLTDGGIEAVEPVRQARLGVNDDDFDKAQGIFHFKKDSVKFSRNISAEVIGNEGHLRIWAQCRREDVYGVISAFV